MYRGAKFRRTSHRALAITVPMCQGLAIINISQLLFNALYVLNMATSLKCSKFNVSFHSIGTHVLMTQR